MRYSTKVRGDMTSLFPTIHITKGKRVTFLLGLPCFNAAGPKCKQHRKSARWKTILCYPRDYKCTAIFNSSWVEKLTILLCLLRVRARENARSELQTVRIFQISSLGWSHLSCWPSAERHFSWYKIKLCVNSLGANRLTILELQSLWITVRTEPRLSPSFTANSSTLTRQSTRINSSIFSNSPSLDVLHGMPGRWRFFSHFSKFPPHYTNNFGRENCHSNEEGRFLRLIYSVFVRSDQISNISILFYFGALH